MFKSWTKLLALHSRKVYNRVYSPPSPNTHQESINSWKAGLFNLVIATSLRKGNSSRQFNNYLSRYKIK